jgi:hypothetical protein
MASCHSAIIRRLMRAQPLARQERVSDSLDGVMAFDGVVMRQTLGWHMWPLSRIVHVSVHAPTSCSSPHDLDAAILTSSVTTSASSVCLIRTQSIGIDHVPSTYSIDRPSGGISRQYAVSRFSNHHANMCFALCWASAAPIMHFSA